MPAADQLRNRVRFDQRGLDANGVRLGAWVEGETVWAQVTYLRGGEGVLADRLTGLQPAVFVVRASPTARAVGPGHRLVGVAGPDVVADQTFNVVAVQPSREAGFLDLLAKAGGADG